MHEQVCWNCKGKGLPDGCPECGKDIDTKISTLPKPNNTLAINSIIPENYRKPWDSQILIDSHSELKEDREFLNYVKKLEDLVLTFRRGTLPRNSSMIMSSVGMGKTVTAYTCIAIAEKIGLKVVPIIDNTEYRRLNNLSTDAYLYKTYLRNNPILPTIEEIVGADICFMTIDQVCFADSFRDIQSLVGKRDRRGKPTIILTSCSLKQMTRTDYDNEFIMSLYDRNISSTKQIQILQYFLGENKYAYANKFNKKDK